MQNQLLKTPFDRLRANGGLISAFLGQESTSLRQPVLSLKKSQYDGVMDYQG
jgi:hypothetical protein